MVIGFTAAPAAAFRQDSVVDNDTVQIDGLNSTHLPHYPGYPTAGWLREDTRQRHASKHEKVGVGHERVDYNLIQQGVR